MTRTGRRLCIPTAVINLGQLARLFNKFLSTSPLLLWTFAYAEDGSVEGCGSSGVYDGDLEPVDCAVLFEEYPALA